MANLLFLVIGLIIAVTGLILALIAKRLPVNPFIGFRIGYTYASRRIWVKYNRLAGISFAIIGLITVILSLLAVPVTLLAAILVVLVLANTVVLSFLAAREAERELGKEAFRIEKKESVEKISRIEPVKPTPLRLVLMILPPILSLILISIYLPLLPSQIPVHFNVAGEPDRWEPLPTFTSITLPILVGFQFIAIVFLLVELKAPLVFYKPGIPKQLVVPVLYDVGIVVSWLVFLALFDILYYAVNNQHFLPNALLTIIILLAIGFILFRVFTLAWMWKKRVRKLYLTEE